MRHPEDKPFAGRIRSRSAVGLTILGMLIGPVLPVGKGQETSNTVTGSLNSATASPSDDLLAKAPSKFARSDGLRVHYKSLGKGNEALVFVHGWACDLTFWRWQAQAFDGKRRMIFIDLPGHGQSDKPPSGYSQERFARAVSDVVRDTRIAHAVLVGHSMGAQVIRQFYRDYPAQTRALIVIDALLWTRSTRESFAKSVEQYRAPDYLDRASRFIDFLLSPNSPPKLRTEVKTKMLAAPQDVMVGGLESLADLNIYRSDAINRPLLAIYAKSKSWPPPSNEQIVRGLAADLDYQEWEGVSHFLMMEEPQRFNAALFSFLDKIGLIKAK